MAECYTSVRNAPPEFGKGCEEEVRLSRSEPGKRWAQRTLFTNEDDCNVAPPEWHARGPEAEADFIEGCRNEVMQRRMAEGRFWARDNFIFTPADCRADLPGVKHNPDFIAGCEDIIQHRPLAQDGQTYAQKNSITRLEACHGTVKNAPPQFEAGCEKYVRDLELAEAQRR